MYWPHGLRRLDDSGIDVKQWEFSSSLAKNWGGMYYDRHQGAVGRKRFYGCLGSDAGSYDGCSLWRVTLCAHITYGVPTGALLSTVSYNEGQSIPGIAHAVMLERMEV